jgi:hypothetical protein
MICPAYGTDAAVLITNVATGSQLCHHCADTECPSFLPNFVLTLEDVRFMRDCGINPEISRIEAVIRGSK